MDDSGLRDTVSEDKAKEEQSLDILEKVGQVPETLNQQREEITQAAPRHTKGQTVESRRFRIDASFTMTGWEFTIRSHGKGFTRVLDVALMQWWLLELSLSFLIIICVAEHQELLETGATTVGSQ